MSDGLLEMTIIPNITALVKGGARRIGQAEGPFEIKFREPEGDKTVQFLQIDGEFFKCTNMLSITFSLAPGLCDGSVWFRCRKTAEDEINPQHSARDQAQELSELQHL